MGEKAPFPNLEGLVDLGRQDGVDIRPTLIRVLTDLYVQKETHTAEEERHYAELALRLLDSVDMQTKSTIAVRLARYKLAPAAIVGRLARDIPELAGEIEDTSKSRAEYKPSEIAGSSSKQHAVRLEAPTPRGASADELSALFLSADGAERRLILLNLDYAGMSAATLTASAETIRRLEAAALKHQRDEFSRELERALVISFDQARRLIDDPSGEPIVVVAKALNMPRDVLQRVLLFLNANIGQSVQRVYELAQLYDEITTSSALRLLAIWRAADWRAERPARHQPVSWEGERHEARYPAAPRRVLRLRARQSERQDSSKAG